jgi:hypothetical protein
MTDFRRRLPASIHWTVEHDGMCLYDGSSHGAHRLPMEQAVIWDLLGRFPTTTAIELIAAVLALPSGEAEQRVRACLQDWTEKGFIER